MAEIFGGRSTEDVTHHQKYAYCITALEWSLRRRLASVRPLSAERARLRRELLPATTRSAFAWCQRIIGESRAIPAMVYCAALGFFCFDTTSSKR